MNSRERYMAVMNGEKSDIVPRVPILMQYAAEYIDSNYGAFASDYQVLTEANIRCAEDFGIDQLSGISDPYRETQGYGAEIVFEQDSVPRCVAHPLAETKDMTVLKKAVPEESERMLDRINAVRLYKEKYGEEYSILGWVEGPAAEAADLRGVGEFLIDTIDDEVFTNELMERCVEVAIKFAESQIRAGADTIGIGDAIASQLSPDLYERLVYPNEKKLVQTIQEKGAFVKLHICGNITHLLPFISELGVDILDVDHMVDMVKVRDTVGNNVTLTGNIDPVEGVFNGTPDTIRDQMLQIYESVGNPYMVNAGCEIPSGTPPEALKALCTPIEFR
jgi:MtaA/CmuA family methyltransferase